MDTPAPGPEPDAGAPAARAAVATLTKPPEAFPMLDGTGMVIVPRRCISCSYNLMGLHAQGPCPECGTPIAQSLRENLLINCPDNYLQRLHSGVFKVQLGLISIILGWLCMIVAPFLASIIHARGSASVSAAWVHGGIAASGLLLVFASLALTLLGWWAFSQPNPRAEGLDRGEDARRLVRLSVLAQVLAYLVFVGAIVVNIISTGFAQTGTGSAIVGFSVIGALILLLVAVIVQFFAAMVYLRWLARLVPNASSERRAKTLLWLGPVLYVLGSVLCFIGPIVTVILYFNLLEKFRIDLKHIRKTLEQKNAGGSVGVVPM